MGPGRKNTKNKNGEITMDNKLHRLARNLGIAGRILVVNFAPLCEYIQEYMAYSKVNDLSYALVI